MMGKSNYYIKLKYYVLFSECLHRYVMINDKLMIFVMGYKRVTLNYITHLNYPRDLVVNDTKKTRNFKLIGEDIIYGINYNALLQKIILPQFNGNSRLLNFLYL